MQAHESCYGLTPIIVWPANYCYLIDRWMFEKDFLDFPWIDICAPEIIKSFDRSFKVKKPSSSKAPMSPVQSQPSRMEVSVASRFCQYPDITTSPRTIISPTSPVGTAVPCLSTTRTSTSVLAIPRQRPVCCDNWDS